MFLLPRELRRDPSNLNIGYDIYPTLPGAGIELATCSVTSGADFSLVSVTGIEQKTTQGVVRSCTVPDKCWWISALPCEVQYNSSWSAMFGNPTNGELHGCLRAFVWFEKQSFDGGDGFNTPFQEDHLQQQGLHLGLGGEGSWGGPYSTTTKTLTRTYTAPDGTVVTEVSHTRPS